jgi:hypothetical protein
MAMTKKQCGYAGEKGRRVLMAEAYLGLGMASAQIAGLTGLTQSEARDIAKEYYLRRTEVLWDLVSTPIKFPAPSRRRREDRKWPKAA